MVRIVLIEEPGADRALAEVAKKLEANATNGAYVHRTVRMLHNGLARMNGEPPQDLLAGLDAFETGPRKLSGIDLIGHGAPGVLSVGGTAAGSTHNVFGGVKEWALLDSDVNKHSSLAPFVKRIRKWKQQGVLADGFELRLLGCNTAIDPGVVPDASITIIQDGPVLIHMMASFLDVRVAGVLGYIGREDFENGTFAPIEAKIRSCRSDPTLSSISFSPDRIPPPNERPDNSWFPIESLRGLPPTLDFGLRPIPVDPGSVTLLLGAFQAHARRLEVTFPLVIRDAVLHFAGATVCIVEQGKALMIEDKGVWFRAAPSVNAVATQLAIAQFLARNRVQRPAWSR